MSSEPKDAAKLMGDLPLLSRRFKLAPACASSSTTLGLPLFTAKKRSPPWRSSSSFVGRLSHRRSSAKLCSSPHAQAHRSRGAARSARSLGPLRSNSDCKRFQVLAFRMHLTRHDSRFLFAAIPHWPWPKVFFCTCSHSHSSWAMSLHLLHTASACNKAFGGR